MFFPLFWCSWLPIPDAGLFPGRSQDCLSTTGSCWQRKTMERYGNHGQKIGKNTMFLVGSSVLTWVFHGFFTKKTHVPIGFHRRSSVESDLFVVRSCWPMFFTLVSASSHLGYSIWTWLNDVDRWIWVDDVDGYFFYRLVDISPAGLWGAPHLDFDPKCEPQRFLDNYLVHWLDCIC